MSHRSSLHSPPTKDRASGVSDPSTSVALTTGAAGRRLRLDAGTTPTKGGNSAAGLALDYPQETLPREPAGETLEEFVFRHGPYFDSYLATEPGRWNFWSRNRRGLISYVQHRRVVLAVGGLIAPDDHREELFVEFMDSLARQKLQAVFYNISEDALPIFRKFNFRITKWGEEPIVDLGNCTWGGKSFEWVRRQTNYCLRQGLAAFELHPDQLEPELWSRTLAELHEVSAESLSRKAQAQMTFFEGQFDDHELGLRRLFVARSADGAGRIEGFVICNPIRNGSAWATELYRRRTDSVRGTMAFLFHHVLNQMQTEGVRQVGLCLDPGRGCAEARPGESALLRRGMLLGDRFMSFIFDLAGQRHFKSRFRPRYENRYICIWPKPTLAGYVAFAKVSGLFNFSLTRLARVCVDRIRKHAARKSLAGGD